MSESDKDDHMRQALSRLPNWLRRSMEWLLRPERRWLRLPVAVLLILGGVLWFLPLLGFWMLPLGLILLAEDIPPLRRWISRRLHSIERWSHRDKR